MNDINAVNDNLSKKNLLQGKSAAFLALGCKVNAYEISAIRQLFEENGCNTVPFEERADFYVINTCTVTNIADHKSRQMLHKAKTENPDACIIAVGCYAQAYEKELEDDKRVDIVIGNGGKDKIIDIVKSYLEDRKRCHLVGDTVTLEKFDELPGAPETELTRAYIKIQDGCNQFCSYCIIPYARGRIRSKSEDKVIEEARKLSLSGYREIVLTGIHISSYGMETYSAKEQFALRPEHISCAGDIPFVHLIMELDKIEGIERIRLGSLEPRIVTEEFVSALLKTKLCPSFHLSLQSGCDETLKRMNRRYSSSDYEKCVGILRHYYENPAITTDIIVGFPGETEEEFSASYEFAKKIGFSRIHVFKYSSREGTKAALMDGQVKPEIKEERSHRLIKLGLSMAEKYERGFLGSIVRVLFEDEASIEYNGNVYRCMRGHTERYVMVYVPLMDTDADCEAGSYQNRFADVKASDIIHGGGLLGNLVE